MSTKLTGYVWDGCAASGMKLSSVAIMARLADFSNDEGVCWPSIETIARQIGAGMSTVRTAIARLEAEGWLTRKARRQGNSMPAAGAGYADFLSERTWLPTNQSGGGNHAGIPFSECSGGASSRTGEKRRHHDKAWRGPGDNASYRGEGRRQRGGRDYPRTACW
ncbi:helix-turn-helix domain-containing protein [Escherichia coli]|nr:helix-turn-helix domain-containing protein [Escherichia coli]